MICLEVSLTPMDAYFLGGEVNALHENSPTQRTKRRPYYIRSNQMLSQSAAFGILRYLGIQNPDNGTFLDPEDVMNIGPESYRISRKEQSFGRIRRISPVLLSDQEGHRYIKAPRNRIAVEKEDVNKNGEADFVPFKQFSPVYTTEGIRFYPAEYSEKKAYDGMELLCLETGKLRGSAFSSQLRTGINRASQKANRRISSGKQNNEPQLSGFFKKEYTVLEKGFSFLYYAEVEEGFLTGMTESGDCFTKPVFVGQGRTPFKACLRVVKEEETKIELPGCCFTDKVKTAIVISDFYYKGKIDDLKTRCSLLISQPRDYREFVTQYSSSVNDGKNRYRKEAVGLKLLSAGSVFIFLGDEAQKLSAEDQAAQFMAYIENCELRHHTEQAGFNQLIYVC